MGSESAAKDNALKGAEERIQAAIERLHAAYGPSLFPLRLTPLEKFLWWDDSATHPLCNFIELHFDGPIDHEVMQRSLHLASHLHPLLISRIVHLDGDWYWQPVRDSEVRLHRHGEQCVTLDGRVRRLDLTQEGGMMAWHESNPAGDRLLFGFHHACCDGNGFRRFLLDVLSIYAFQRVGERGGYEASEWIPPEVFKRWQPQRLMERFDFTACWPSRVKQPLTVWQRIKNAHYFHFQTPEPLSSLRTGQPEPSHNAHSSLSETAGQIHSVVGMHDAFLRRVVERDQTARLLARCQETGVRINELCLAALFRSCVRWQQHARGSHARRRLRLLMPFAMMAREDLGMPATNRLSLAFLGRTEEQCAAWEPLLKSIRQEVETMRASQLPMDFLRGLQAGSHWPAAMRWGIRNSRKMCTAVLSFGGDIARGRGHRLRSEDGMLDLGDCRLVHVFGAPPVRIHTNVALGVCVSGGSLCIAQAWSREAFDAVGADRFMLLFLDELAEWLSANSTAAS